MISFPRPLAGSGRLARAMAAASSASTSGRASTAADGRRKNRVCVPEPLRIFAGSGRPAPWRKHRPTPLARAAIDDDCIRRPFRRGVPDHEEVVVVVDQFVRCPEATAHRRPDRPDRPLILGVELGDERSQPRPCGFHGKSSVASSAAGARRGTTPAMTGASASAMRRYPSMSGCRPSGDPARRSMLSAAAAARRVSAETKFGSLPASLTIHALISRILRF